MNRIDLIRRRARDMRWANRVANQVVGWGERLESDDQAFEPERAPEPPSLFDPHPGGER